MATGPRWPRPDTPDEPQPADPEPVRHGPTALALRCASALLVILLAAGCADAADDGARGSDRHEGWRGVRLEDPIRMPEATLTDTRGRPHRLREEARGRVTLLFFGYTHCPDVCPVQMANLGAVLEDLAPSERQWIEVVFVTVDPRRDSATRLRSWLDRFGQGFVGLRGDSARVARLQRRLGIAPAVRQEREVRGRYTVGHGSQVLAFGPDARARLAYPSGTRQRDWARDLPRLVRRTRRDSTSASQGG